MKTHSGQAYSLFARGVPREGQATTNRSRFLRHLAGMDAALDGLEGVGRWLLAIHDPFLFAVAMVACWKRGFTPVVSADLQPGTVAELAGRLAGVLSDREMACGTVVVEVSLVEATVEATLPRFNAEDAALIMFTSGSTGARKEVSKSFRSLLEEVATLEATFGEQVDGLPRFSTVSHFHIYGLLFHVLWPLVQDQSPGHPSVFYWEEVLGATTNGACIVSSPAHLRFLADTAGQMSFEKDRFVVFSSGGPLAREVSLGIERVGLRVPIEVFGSTETGGVAWRTQGQSSDGLFTPLAGVEARCDGDRLQIRSPWLADPEQWTATGDTAIMDGNRFSLSGRFDRIAKIAGKRVSLDEMEEVLAKDSRLAAVRVFQTSGDTGDSRSALAVVAAVEPFVWADVSDRKYRELVIRELKELLRFRFEPVTFPRRWRFVEALPVNSQGKTTVSLLAELIANE